MNARFFKFTQSSAIGTRFAAAPWSVQFAALLYFVHHYCDCFARTLAAEAVNPATACLGIVLCAIISAFSVTKAGRWCLVAAAAVESRVFFMEMFHVGGAPSLSKAVHCIPLLSAALLLTPRAWRWYAKPTSAMRDRSLFGGLFAALCNIVRRLALIEWASRKMNTLEKSTP